MARVGVTNMASYMRGVTPTMYGHGLGTLETERSNRSHRVDMINIEMFTIDDYPISRDDRTWVS